MMQKSHEVGTGCLNHERTDAARVGACPKSNNSSVHPKFEIQNSKLETILNFEFEDKERRGRVTV